MAMIAGVLCIIKSTYKQSSTIVYLLQRNWYVYIVSIYTKPDANKLFRCIRQVTQLTH